MTVYLEMARDPVHGGEGWSFAECVWAPTRKRDGSRWNFWEKIREIRTGDIILHLKGISPNAKFVGYSVASCDGFVSPGRPPSPGDWSLSTEFYRANIENFTPFQSPINLTDIFRTHSDDLKEYFDTNRSAGVQRKNIFYVIQSGRLQCLNGAYLSEVDESLFNAIFGSQFISEIDIRDPMFSVETGMQLSTIKRRIGQAKFAREIKQLYGHQCCFPGCGVDDERFLIGSHIARWSDNEMLQGHLGNGLCLCVLHDKAFEHGLFTLDEKFRVFVNPHELTRQSKFVAQSLVSANGIKIKTAEILPLEEALLEHWVRLNLSPSEVRI